MITELEAYPDKRLDQKKVIAKLKAKGYSLKGCQMTLRDFRALHVMLLDPGFDYMIENVLAAARSIHIINGQTHPNLTCRWALSDGFGQELLLMETNDKKEAIYFRKKFREHIWNVSI